MTLQYGSTVLNRHAKRAGLDTAEYSTYPTGGLHHAGDLAASPNGRSRCTPVTAQVSRLSTSTLRRCIRSILDYQSPVD